MQTDVKVRCGKPILKLKYRSLRAVQICTLCICACTVLYCVNLFSLVLHLVSTVSIYIDLVTNNGMIYPCLVSLAAIVSITINAFAVYYLVRAFSPKKNKLLNVMLFMFVIVCLIAVLFYWLLCIFVLHHTYSQHEDIHDGIINAMKNYSKDSLTKARVDMMQVENECCGSKNYTDWYAIKWYDANLINSGSFPGLKGETPYSCCSINSAYPCIHHGIEVTAKAYLYTKEANISISVDGCHSVILTLKENTGWIIVLRLLLLILFQSLITMGLRLIQTAHTERKSFDREDKVYTCWLLGCYAGKTRQVIKPVESPVRPDYNS